jgi:hypothetical protein
VWITDCKGGQNPAVAEAPIAPQPAARQPARTPTPRHVQPRPDQRGFLPALR